MKETRIFAPLVRYTRVSRETTRHETKSSIHDVRHKYLHVSLWKGVGRARVVKIRTGTSEIEERIKALRNL